MTYWVELTAPFFSCPVSFPTLDRARDYARRQRAAGAFRAQIFALETGAYTGALIETL